jgi:hypothetical protein
MPGKTYIILTTQFEALHSWPDCDIEDMKFLKNTHRHVFHVVMKWQVHHDDRDKEFISYKRSVTKWIRENWEGKDLGSKSCEMLAKNLAYSTNADYVKVMEDNENGAEWIRSNP